MNYQSEDIFAIRVISAECNNENISIKNEILECENKNKECIFTNNKMFNSISYDIIADETIFMPVCNDNHAIFCISSLNIDDDYIKTLKEKIYEIVELYIDSQIEEEEEKHKESLRKINRWSLIKEKIKNDNL